MKKNAFMEGIVIKKSSKFTSELIQTVYSYI